MGGKGGAVQCHAIELVMSLVRDLNYSSEWRINNYFIQMAYRSR